MEARAGQSDNGRCPLHHDYTEASERHQMRRPWSGLTTRVSDVETIGAQGLRTLTAAIKPPTAPPDAPAQGASAERRGTKRSGASPAGRRLGDGHQA